MSNPSLFTKPTRQSSVAILLIIQKFALQLFRQLWPILLLLIVGNAGNRSNILLLTILFFTGLSMIWGLISYYNYFFFIQSDELHINRGVLRKVHLNIPIDRIQSINFQRTPIHRLFKVVSVQIDTAGSSKSEISLDALSLQRAQHLRNLLLKEKKSDIAEADLSQPDVLVKSDEELIFKIDLPALLTISISQNHLKSGWIFIAFGLWLFSQLEEFGIDIEPLLRKYLSIVDTSSNLFYAYSIGLLVIISIIISIVRTLIRFYNLKLWRLKEKYRLVNGLFTRHEVAILDKKVQILEWADNPIKRIFKLFDVYIKQASGSSVSKKKSIVIPGCQVEQIHLLQDQWLGHSLSDSIVTQGVSVHYFYRRLAIRILFVSILAGLLFVFNRPYALYILLLVPILLLTSWLAYKKRMYRVSDDNLFISKGVIGDHFALMPLYKIQSVSISQSLYEQRRGLASLLVNTASGNMKIPFIDLISAKAISDYLLYKVESSNRSWM